METTEHNEFPVLNLKQAGKVELMNSRVKGVQKLQSLPIDCLKGRPIEITICSQGVPILDTVIDITLDKPMSRFKIIKKELINLLLDNLAVDKIYLLKMKGLFKRKNKEGGL